MCLKIRCDGKSEKFCKNFFLELNKALLYSTHKIIISQPWRLAEPATTNRHGCPSPVLHTSSSANGCAEDEAGWVIGYGEKELKPDLAIKDRIQRPKTIILTWPEQDARESRPEGWY